MNEWFTTTDLAVLIGYLVLTTVIGHKMGGKQATISDFFAGGKSLPWWAVSGSIIATEISGVTFIGVPGGVLAAGGNFTYMLWGIGSIVGRVIVGMVFVKVFYEDEIYSPYDYMGRRIKPQLKTLATVFFTVGSILGQSVRILVAALPLKVVTGLPFEMCILIIGAFAIAWTLMGGMRTVIWTDVMQFVLFTIGGLITLIWITTSIEGGWATLWETASAAGKTQMWDGRFGLGPELEFTFWVAIIAVPFQNVAAFGVDQLNAQRMFCCKNAGDARKAIIVSSIGQLLTYLMLLVGAALFTFYYLNPPEGKVAAELGFGSAEGMKTLAGGGHPADSDRVFPVWIVSELPPGLAGLILAGVFAAAISSLDSILAALSQTTISLIYNPENNPSLDQANLVKQSRRWVVIWGVTLTLFTLLMNYLQNNLGVPILSLAFGMTSYTMGPLLGMFLCALIGKGSFRGILIGACLSFLLTMFIRMDIWILVAEVAGGVDWLTNLPSYAFNDEGKVVATIGSHWMWPVGTILTLAGGLIGARKGRLVKGS
ncbi:MAG: sodium/solute symporter [Akkermansiaceae bacterium]|jgi:SSS family solute:Na+ symporter